MGLESAGSRTEQLPEPRPGTEIDRRLNVSLDARELMGRHAPPAGVSRYVVNLVAALSRQTQAVSLSALIRADCPVPIEWHDSQITLKRVHRRLPLWSSHVVAGWLLDRGDPELVHGLAGYLPMYRLRQAKVLTVHDLTPYSHPHFHPGGQSLGLRAVVPWSLRHADQIIAVSACTADDLHRLFGIDASRVSVVHEGVSEQFWKPPAADPAVLAKELDLPSEPFLLCVGTIEPRKNLEAALVVAESTGLPLVIAGARGWMSDGFLARLGRSPARSRIRLLGQVDAVTLPELMRSASVLLYPSWYEGFGLPPLEAMACGTPVVASRAGALGEVLGDAALLCEPSDHDAMASACQRLVEDPGLRQKMVRVGVERAAQFSWQEAARQTIQIYLRAVGADEAPGQRLATADGVDGGPEHGQVRPP